METYVQFQTGQKMPLLGFGTAYSTEDSPLLENSLNTALANGYRHFDTAFQYKNEHVLGKVLSEWINAGKLRRDELFVTTKLPAIGMDETLVDHFLIKSIEGLQLDYVDLYLMHWPVAFEYVNDSTLIPIHEDGTSLAWNLTSDFIAVWKKMEALVKAEKVKAIGIANFNASQIERLVAAATILPSNLQVEANVYFQQKSLRETCTKYGITFTAYCALGSPGRSPREAHRYSNLLEDQILCGIAASKGKTAAQIALRFLVQQNISVIPKSCKTSRIKDNALVFDFCLTPDEMRMLEALDKGEDGRKCVTSVYPGAANHPECPF